MSVLLDIKAVSKSFQHDHKVIDGMDLQVEKGAIVALVGESGCGKTTLLRMIAGFEYADEGSILLEGKNLTHMAPEKRAIGMFFQDYALFPHLSVMQNIMYGLSAAQKKQESSRIENLMRLAGLEGLGERYPHELSGGQQQRVALLRALAPQPKLILLDEPFSNIDVLVKDQVRAELKRLFKEAGVTVVFVTHDIKDALYLADRLVLMRNGKIVQNDSAHAIYVQPQNAYVAAFMGKLNRIAITTVENGFETAFGLIRKKHDFALGMQFDIYCRPEQLRVRYDESARNSVEEQYFLGNYNELLLQNADARLFVQCNEQVLWDRKKTVAVDLLDYHFWPSTI
jgi:iron(III) transport system ATP-binding protein